MSSENRIRETEKKSMSYKLEDSSPLFTNEGQLGKK